jgi:hypothetical protein
MEEAAGALRSDAPGKALDPQEKAYAVLERIWSIVARFDRILNRAIALQDRTLEATEAAVPDAGAGPGTQARVPPAAAAAERIPENLDDLAADQSRVGTLTRLMVERGRQELDQLETAAGATSGAPATDESEPPGDDSTTVPRLRPVPPEGEGEVGEQPANEADGENAAGAAAEDEARGDEERGEATEGDGPEQGLAQLRAAVEKAEELAPRILELAEAAAEDLRRPDPEAALPREEEIRDLLAQIAELLPRQEGQQSGQDGNQGQSPDESEENSQDQDQSPGEQQPPDQGQQSGDQEQESTSQEPSEQPAEMSPQQIQTLLRMAEEREREAREKRQELEALLGSPRKVDRDW